MYTQGGGIITEVAISLHTGFYSLHCRILSEEYF